MAQVQEEREGTTTVRLPVSTRERLEQYRQGMRDRLGRWGVDLNEVVEELLDIAEGKRKRRR